MEQRFKALLTFIDANYIHSNIIHLPYLSERFEISPPQIRLLFKTQLQTRWKDYIYKKKIDYAAEVLANEKVVPFLNIVQIIGWERREGAEYNQRLNCYGIYPWVLDFEALFTMRFGWRPERWMNLDMGVTKEEGISERYRQRRLTKLEKYHTHRETWQDLWGLTDEEKRRKGLSFSEMYRERIHLTRNWRNHKTFATSEAYFESYLFRNQRRRNKV